MTTAHGLCIGPEHALNVHRDCPGCSCSCHAENPRGVRDSGAATSPNDRPETGRIGGKAKGRIALTNPTLLATVSTTAKGA